MLAEFERRLAKRSARGKAAAKAASDGHTPGAKAMAAGLLAEAAAIEEIAPPARESALAMLDDPATP